MAHKAKEININQSEEINKVAKEIYAYFKENNARMTDCDASLVFDKYPEDVVFKAFAMVTNFKGMQQTGVNDGHQHYGKSCPIYGYSKDGSSIEDEGYWVRGPLRINKNGIARIPTQLFKGFLISQPRRVDIINEMLNFAVYDRSLYCKSASKACEFLKVKSEDADGVAKQGKEISQNIHSRSYYYLDANKLINIRDNKYFTNEQATLFLMYYALGSIKGNREYVKIHNGLLLSRMDGNDGEVSPDEWSEEIREISTRRKLERLRKLVSDYYKVTFFGGRMRGFVFSMDYDKAELAALLAVKNKSKSKKQKASQSGKKEETDAQLLDKMKGWIDRKDLSEEDVRRRIMEVRKEKEERKRRKEQNSEYEKDF